MSAGADLPLRPFEVGVATRPRRNEPANGDAVLVREGDGEILCGVIDGLGHGEGAEAAARRARTRLEAHPGWPLDLLFREVDQAVRATRGVVMGVARADARAGFLDVAVVGNVEARLLAFPRSRIRPRRGILGFNAPPAAPRRHPWEPGSVLVLHSDGVSPAWTWADLLDTWTGASAAARGLLEAFGRPEDDASVLVLRGGGHGR